MRRVPTTEKGSIPFEVAAPRSDGLAPRARARLRTGFIALVSVILISFMLVVFAASVGMSGYYARANQLNSEVKEQSIASARACVEKAIVDIAASHPTTGTVTFGGGVYSCTINAITADSPVSGQTTIKSQGVYQRSYTNLVVVVDSDTQDVISWREYATMP